MTAGMTIAKGTGIPAVSRPKNISVTTNSCTSGAHRVLLRAFGYPQTSEVCSQGPEQR